MRDFWCLGLTYVHTFFMLVALVGIIPKIWRKMFEAKATWIIILWGFKKLWCLFMPRDCQQITFVILNGFCLISKPLHPHPPIYYYQKEPMVNHWQLLVNFPVPLVNWWLVKYWLPIRRKLPMLWLVIMKWQIIDNHW